MLDQRTSLNVHGPDPQSYSDGRPDGIEPMWQNPISPIAKGESEGVEVRLQLLSFE